MVKGGKGPTGNINNFEDVAAYLTPWDLVANNHNTNRKCGSAEISNTSGVKAQVLATRENQGRGYIGVDFRYYKHDEFSALSKEQCDDII